jgi:hypothetical protein
MWGRRLAMSFALGAGVAAIGLGACDPRSFVPSDGTGFGVWVTNESDRRLFIAFEPDPGGRLTWDVPSGTTDARGPWISFDVDGSAGQSGQVVLYDEDCDVLETFEADAGEYRLRIRADGMVTLSPDDVPNDAGNPLPPASTTC